MSDISEKGSDFLRDLGDAARKNPFSAALIGMGVLWLFTGGRTAERAGDLVRGAGLTAFPMPPAMLWMRRVRRCGPARIHRRPRFVGNGNASRAGGGGGPRPVVAPRRIGCCRRASGYAKIIPDAGGALFGTARANLTELFRTQPLAWARSGSRSAPALQRPCRQPNWKPNISAKPAIPSRNRPPIRIRTGRARGDGCRGCGGRGSDEARSRALPSRARNRRSPISQERSAASSMRRARAFPIG